jgi:hypothetical protein
MKNNRFGLIAIGLSLGAGTCVPFLASPRPLAAPAPSSSINLPGSGRIAYQVNSSANSDRKRGPMHIAWLQGGNKFRYDTNFTSSIPAGLPEGTLARTMTVHS